MTAVDTNIIVRFLVRDDEEQAQEVYSRLKRAEADGESLFVSLIVLAETIRAKENYRRSRRITEYVNVQVRRRIRCRTR